MADQIIADIKDRLDIAEVIGGYMQIKKAGTNFKGLCPFHNEKTPSFVVTPSRQIWHCFGCGEGGDVFSFVQKFENLDFPQTIKLLADRVGVKLPEFRPSQPGGQEDIKDLLIRINTFAAKFYHQILLSPQGKQALEYLKKRGLKLETIKHWQIGFAPNNFQVLAGALQKKKVKGADAVKAGVLIKNEKGNVYDRFRGRITFPISNYLGEVVGFSARILPSFDDGKSGKYINSPETAVYNKSRILFGLDRAKNAIRKKDEVIVVEGQMDAVSAQEAGFANTVASSGTALTDEHLKLLGRLTKNLKFCFDADQAGLLATRRAVENILGKDFNIKIVQIGEGAKDPDELIRKNPDAWSRAVAQARLFLDFYTDKLFSQVKVLDLEAKKNLRDQILPLLKKLNDALEQEHYLKLLAPRLETTPGALKEGLNKLKAGVKLGPVSTQEQAPQNAVRQRWLEDEKLVLGAMITNPKICELVRKEGQIEDFSSAEIIELVKTIFSHGELSAAQLSSTLAKEAVFMVELRQEESASAEAFQKDLTNAFFALRRKTLDGQEADLQQKIRQAESGGEDVTVLMVEFNNLTKLKNKFKTS